MYILWLLLCMQACVVPFTVNRQSCTGDNIHLQWILAHPHSVQAHLALSSFPCHLSAATSFPAALYFAAVAGRCHEKLKHWERSI